MISLSLLGGEKRSERPLCEELCWPPLYAHPWPLRQIQAQAGTLPAGHLPIVRLTKNGVH